MKTEKIDLHQIKSNFPSFLRRILNYHEVAEILYDIGLEHMEVKNEAYDDIEYLQIVITLMNELTFKQAFLIGRFTDDVQQLSDKIYVLTFAETNEFYYRLENY